MLKMNWKKEIARDCIALGSLPFYLIVLARSTIGQYWPFVIQMTAGIAFLYLITVFAKFDKYSSRSFLILVFTTLFYQNIGFTILASILWICILFSLNYLKTDKKELLKGVLVGLACAGIAYFVSGLIVL